MLALLATYRNPVWGSEKNPLVLEPYRVNLLMAVTMRQVDPAWCQIEGQMDAPAFKAALIRVDFPGEENNSLWVNGDLDDVLMRLRQEGDQL